MENAWDDLTKIWKDDEIRDMCNDENENPTIFHDSNEVSIIPQINILKNQQVQLEGDNAIVRAQVKIPLDLLDTSQEEIQGVPNQILELQKDLLLGFPRTTAISFKYLYDCPPISNITINECEVNQYQVDIHKPQKPVRNMP